METECQLKHLKQLLSLSCSKCKSDVLSKVLCSKICVLYHTFTEMVIADCDIQISWDLHIYII